MRASAFNPRRRAQTRAESVIALALFAIAGLGVWLLFRAEIAATLGRMMAAIGGLISRG